MNPLDLYAKIESLIGFDDHYETLYQRYLKELKSLHVRHILDIGCGNGKFLAHLRNEGFNAVGIDRSEAMVQRALQLGVEASTQELEAFDDGHFECVVAIADVLNYMDTSELTAFVSAVHRVLKSGGYFLCDINTLFGFENVADGTMVKDEGNHFLSVEAIYADKKLTTQITLFEKEGEMYRKLSGEIVQYFHALLFFKKLKKWKLLTTTPVSLFSRDADKTLLCLQKI